MIKTSEGRNGVLKVNKIEPQTVEHFDPEGNSLGFLNEYESTDLRAQIAEQCVSGYSLEFEGKRYNINKYGAIPNQPAGLFDNVLESIEKIVRYSILNRQNVRR